MRIRFFNTFDTAAPFLRTLLPHLASQGHQVEAVLSSREYRPGGLGRGDGSYRVRHMPALSVPAVKGRASRLSIAASYAVSSAALSLVGGRWDVNVFLTQPPLFNSWAYVLKRLRRQPYCIVGMDLYPWVAIEAGVLDPGSPAARLGKAVAEKTLTHAKHVVAIGRCMAEKFSRWGVPPERIHVIPNWADTEVLQPVAATDNELRRQHGLDRRFVVMYSGNLGVSHYFDDLLEVARRLSPEPDVVFLFVGAGSRLAEVQERSRRLGLHNIRFLGYQRYEDLSRTLSIGDVHFVSLREGFEGLVVPSKTYGIMAVGRPMVYQGSENGEIARMIREEDIGLTVKQEDPDGLERAILAARAKPDWRREAGRRARTLSEGRFGMSRALSAYASLFTTTGTASGRSRVP